MIYSATNIKPSIVNLFKGFTNFMENDVVKISSFYSKSTNQYPQSSFTTLFILKNTSNEILIFLSENKSILDNTIWFEYLEQIEQIDTYLQMLINTPKWYRLTKSNNGYKYSLTQNNVLSQHQTIEQSITNNNFYKNADTDSSEIEFINRLTELDYDKENGTAFSTSVLSDFSIFSNDSVVDVMGDDSIYGKDIAVNFAFVDNDINALDTKKTLYQSADILLNLTKGDNPEFSNDGVQKNLLVGTTKAFISLPVLVRQWQENFYEDSTFKSINVQSIETRNDILEITFSIEPIVGDSFLKNTTA